MILEFQTISASRNGILMEGKYHPGVDSTVIERDDERCLERNVFNFWFTRELQCFKIDESEANRKE
jgi:hypothetical protein